MDRRGMLGVLGAALAFLPGLRSAGAATPAATDATAGRAHRLSFGLDSGDTPTMSMTLNNIHNFLETYAARHEPAAVEVVAYGPGLKLLRDDTSPLKDRLAALHQASPAVRFSACANTLHAMEKAEGKTIPLLPMAVVVPAGIVRVVELQEQGWAYVRP